MANSKEENNIKSKFTIYYGIDEGLIVEFIESKKANLLKNDQIDFNFISIDGRVTSTEEIINACETLPVFSENKLVVVYRALFLRENGDAREKKIYEEISKYIKNLPDFTTLILYYVLDNPREKMNKLLALQRNGEIIKIEPLKGNELLKRAGMIFEKKGVKIDKVLLSLFCNRTDPNLYSLNNEIDKLSSYLKGGTLTREAILLLMPKKSDDDIFDLVDAIAARKLEIALDILNEIIFKGGVLNVIVSMIERQFKLIYTIKEYFPSKMNQEDICKKLLIKDFMFSKIKRQGDRFTCFELEEIICKCIECEKNLKTNSQDQKTEIELLIVSAINT